MFSLIISIIAIALVAALALAAIYYGTDAYKGNMEDARAAQIINESSQIEGAILAYNVEKGQAPNIKECAEGATDCEPLETLIDSGYLSSAPSSSNNTTHWSVSNIFSKDGKNVSALVKSVSATSCARANEMVGFKGVAANAGLTAAANPEKPGETLDLVPICKDGLPNEVICCATAE